MKIKSNTAGKLNKIIKGSVFSNEFIFIKEFFQNSQRAKATSVNIEVDECFITFKDNGVGCKKPSDILTLDLSQWSSTNEGFGIGFWSCLAFKDVREVILRSYNWSAKISIDNLLNNNLEIELTEDMSIIDGFEITLKTHQMDDNRILRLLEEIDSVAKYLDLDTICNGSLVEKIDIFSSVNGEFIKDIENKYFKARFSIAKHDFNCVKLFYDNREAGYFYNLGYIKGVLSPKSGKLTFKEPDRDSYVTDDKYFKFKDKINEEIKKLYVDFIKSNPNQDTLNKYAEAIDAYLSVNDYEKYIDFSSLLNEDAKKSLDEKVETDNNYNILDNTESNTLDIHNEEYTDECATSYDNDNSDYTISKEDFCKDDYVVQNQMAFPITNNTSKNKSNHNNFAEFKKYIKRKNKLTWVLKEDIEKYQNQISRPEYINIEVMKVDNILYANVLKKYNKMHISEIENSLIETFSYKNIELKSGKEVRFIQNLIPICNKYNLPYNTFVIGDVEVTRQLTHNEKVIYKEKTSNKKDKIEVFAVKSGECIILDRKALNLSRFNIQQDKPFGINDLKAVFANINTIAHELAHLMYFTKDNTIEHYTVESKIQSEITELYI